MGERYKAKPFYMDGEVAEIVNTDARTVKNFKDVPKYGIRPTEIGSGRGSRRVLKWGQVLKVSVAAKLERFGFDAEAIAHAIGMLSSGDLVKWSESKASDVPMLTCIDGAWQLSGTKPKFDWGQFTLNLAAVLHAAIERAEKYQQGHVTAAEEEE